MKTELKSLAILTLILVSFTAPAQRERMLGLWSVEKVTVGEENMTPVAKWTRINADGTYQVGNGWLQNGSGRWKYDAENNRYSATDPLALADEFGGFSVSFHGTNMRWQRAEEGMQVEVSLVPIEELPRSPADYLKGIWELVEITENETSILGDFDPENTHKLFIRWDRIYLNFTPEGNRWTGYWHIHGHKPEVTLLPHQENGTVESWRVTVNEKELRMTGISDSNQTIKRHYVRRNTF
ncbi:hypothetical protein [Cyclobacterium xiamenense]|uniref:hypothetical protein n=1 Tax=Cyclobacterium xiamenense TaxID=1297121 RepID=UPI0035CF1079